MDYWWAAGQFSEVDELTTPDYVNLTLLSSALIALELDELWGPGTRILDARHWGAPCQNYWGAANQSLLRRKKLSFQCIVAGNL